MKTAMKKLFSLVLVAVLLVGVMPFQAFASTDVWIELEPGTYTVNDEFIETYYTGEGTPTKYFVHQYAYQNATFTLQEKTRVMLAIEEFAPVAEPDICDNCNGDHKTEECTKTNCTVCDEWTDHAADAHCDECDALKSACPVTCPGNENYVDPTPATIKVQINNGTFAGTFTVEAGKNADAVYAAYKASSLASQYEGAYGPVVTLEDGVTAMGATEAGKTYYLWLSWDEVVEDPTTEPSSNVCDKCDAEAINGMCTGCYLDVIDCNCGETTTQKPENAAKVTLNYNYKGAPKSGSVTVSEGDELINVIASIPAPTREGHLFSHWTMDAEGYDLINNETVPAKGVTIYAQWDDDLALGGKLTLSIHLYKDTWADDLENIKKGAKMGDVLDYVDTPVRNGYKFMGWYWDRDCKDAVKESDKLYKNDTIYAKWDRRLNTNEMMLKIYLNDNTRSVAKIVDLYEYSRDGKITKSEVDKIVKKYYTQASSGDDMDIDGLFTSTTWNNGRYSMRNAEKVIYVEDDVETIVYVMVRDAKAVDSSSSSSAAADSSNPKTGDMIYNAVVIMCASAACLATLFFLNKKRAH